jgi:alkanesulfonate monooxygenase SsuD/methylene tetrahydromethanopterin reductase-like flavin-dependent oxidoreductase (luciferase family)
VVRTAEETGYEAVFVPEIAGREAFSTLAGFASATDAIQLGTGVVTVWSRTPSTTAMAAATVHDLSGGRLVLGVGAGTHQGVVATNIAATTSSLELVRRYVHAVRQALEGRPVRPEDGDLFGVGGFELGLKPAGLAPPPIWLAALGDRMIGLAGEIADGVLLNWCTPERVARARDIVASSAARGGRDPKAVTIAVYVRACLGVEERAAVPALKEMTGLYASIPPYGRQMETMGLGSEAALAARAVQAGRPADVPDALVDALTVRGGRREALSRFDAYRAAGAQAVLCYPVAALDPFSSVLGTVLAAAPSPAIAP